MHADAEPGSLLGKQKKSAADELSPEQDARFAPFVAMNRFHLT